MKRKNDWSYNVQWRDGRQFDEMNSRNIQFSHDSYFPENFKN